MVNLETHVLARLNGELRRDLPQHVYPKGKRGLLYFVAAGVCQRMHHELGSAEFADQYAALASSVQKPKRKGRVSTPHARRSLPPAPILWRLFDYLPCSGVLVHRWREDWMFSDLGRSTPETQARVWNSRNAGKRAGGYARMMCAKMYYRDGQSDWSCGAWHMLTLGQIADLGVRHWSRCTNIGPLGVEVIKWVLDEAASGRCPFLAVKGRAAVDAYVPTVRAKEAGE